MKSQPLKSDPCPVCGEIHEPGPVGEPGSWIEGLELKVCPNIPEGFIWADGQLVRIEGEE